MVLSIMLSDAYNNVNLSVEKISTFSGHIDGVLHNSISWLQATGLPLNTGPNFKKKLSPLVTSKPKYGKRVSRLKSFPFNFIIHIWHASRYTYILQPKINHEFKNVIG